MVVVFAESGLSMLDTLEHPLVLQEYINHDAAIAKVCEVQASLRRPRSMDV